MSLKLLRGKRGDAATGTIERAFEFILPFLAFLTILYIVWSVGSSRGAQTYFQTVEFANIIDAANSFHGQFRLKYIPIEPDFSFIVSRDKISTLILDAKAVSVKPIHLTQDIFLDNRINVSGSSAASVASSASGIANSVINIGQIQFLKTNNGIGIGGLKTNLFTSFVYKRDQQLCPTTAQKSAGFVEYTANSLPVDISQKNIAITGTKKIYVDMQRLELIDSGISQDILSKLSSGGLPLADSQASADVIISIAAEASTSNSGSDATVLVFPDNNPQIQQLACVITTQFSAGDTAQSQFSVRPSLISSDFNPYTGSSIDSASSAQATTPTMHLDLTYVIRSAGDVHPLSIYSTLISNAIKNAYAQVYNDGVQ